MYDNLSEKKIPVVYSSEFRQSAVQLAIKGTAHIPAKIYCKGFDPCLDSLEQPMLVPIVVWALKTSQSGENRRCATERSFCFFSCGCAPGKPVH